MNIGVIGFGDVGKAFTGMAIRAGHSVKISGSRGPDALHDAAKTFGSNVSAVTTQEAARCDIVLLAVPLDDVIEVLSKLTWNGQIIIDPINPYHGRKGSFTRFSAGNFSTSQFIAYLAPGASVVKTLNTMSMETLESETPDGTRRVVLLSGDDNQAKQKVAALLTDFGLYPLDLGNLREGGLLQQLDGPFALKDLLIAT